MGERTDWSWRKKVLVSIVFAGTLLLAARLFTQQPASVDPQLSVARCASDADCPMRLCSVDFEIFGKVQGVFFRVNTARQAESLSLVGWCKNLPSGSVLGVAQGDCDSLARLKHWLRHTGSPASRIDRAEFRNERDVDTLEYSAFEVIRRKKGT